MSLAYADARRQRSWWRRRISSEWVTGSVTRAAKIMSPSTGDPATTQSLGWVDVIEDRIADLQGLGANWDGRGSAAVRAEALAFAVSMLEQVMAPMIQAPSIVPLGHGGVQLEWSNDKAEVDVEVLTPNNITVYHHDRASGEEREWPAETEFSALAGLLRTNFTRP